MEGLPTPGKPGIGVILELVEDQIIKKEIKEEEEDDEIYVICDRPVTTLQQRPLLQCALTRSTTAAVTTISTRPQPPTSLIQSILTKPSPSLLDTARIVLPQHPHTSSSTYTQHIITS